MEESQIPFSLIGLANNLRKNEYCVDRFLSSMQENERLSEFSPEIIFAIGWSSGTILEASTKIQGLIKDCYPSSEKITIPVPIIDYENPEKALIDLKKYLDKLIVFIEQLAQKDIQETDIIIDDQSIKNWLASN
jgi:hypothetical protein